ncbi:hypothetical protein AD006_01410 [Pseudonocardia sp. EC080610-09]|uniref:hypothetical protein n=1 Tax=unclassified Pseudonocardia TaxID=2619320 RepID=UPI0006CB0BFB|nr:MULTISPECIES: hypothetical protein [unclassified Pseudonocardia]ALE74967.1 hypothetical protein FRP1_22220 [Pseudonocardia sp. EC080625-04]ALL74315.1 hypothetical protein AD006_01410 [Pseudonocardia sp. EC080610-09]ALL81338.1 hypothetical protein AD017_09235 [Pseudonocardia sp. EC080619-01]
MNAPETTFSSRRALWRVATVGALTVPLALGSAGMAFAGDYGDGGHGKDGKDRDCSPSHASQKGGLLGLDAAVDPALNLGGIANDGPVSQQSTKVDRSNSGIAQSGCGAGDAVQVDDLVGLGLDVSPSANVGGILSSGAVEQSTTDVDESNSGILQSGSGKHGQGGGHASQKGGLIDVDASVNPTLNIGGLLSSGPVSQSSTTVDSSNSGIVQG